MIEELVNYCNNCFSTTVINQECGKELSTSCSDCLKEIHYNQSPDRQYDCPSMCYWYVCQNIYRYATEMIWLFHDIKPLLNSATKQIKICSIGSGPASELIALEEYRAKNKLTFDYAYTGFDTNTIWKPIQDKLVELSAEPDKIRFVNNDVFEYYKTVDERPHIIILNYMLSDMLRHGRQPFEEFLERFYDFVDTLPAAVIFINDINLGRDETEPRYYFSEIYRRLRKNISQGYYKCTMYHFADSIKAYFQYGIQRSNNTLLISPPNEIANKYKTNTECHSAQLLFIKKKEK